MALVLSLIILLLVAAVCVLGLWGMTNAATALTLAMTNAVQQTMMTILACTLLAMMPLLLLGAFKLGEVRGEHKRAVRDVTVHRLVKLPKPRRIGYLIQELPDVFEHALAQSRTAAHRTAHTVSASRSEKPEEEMQWHPFQRASVEL